MVHNVGDQQLEILYWTQKQKNGVICHHCQFLGTMFFYFFKIKLSIHALCIYALLALDSFFSHVGQSGAQVPPWNKFTRFFHFPPYNCICIRCIEVCTTRIFTIALPLVLLLQILMSEYSVKLYAVKNLNQIPFQLKFFCVDMLQQHNFGEEDFM